MWLKTKGDNKFENVSAAVDRPNEFGPNLSVIDINGIIPNDNTPAIDNHLQVSSDA